MTSNFQLYDSVQLSMDLPQHGLQRGTRGAIVEVYGSDDYEVEVFDADGFTIDVLTLKGSQLAMLGQEEKKIEFHYQEDENTESD